MFSLFSNSSNSQKHSLRSFLLLCLLAPLSFSCLSTLHRYSYKWVILNTFVSIVLLKELKHFFHYCLLTAFLGVQLFVGNLLYSPQPCFLLNAAFYSASTLSLYQLFYFLNNSFWIKSLRHA